MLATEVLKEFKPEDMTFPVTAAPFGAASIALRIGPLAFRLEGLSRRQAGGLAGRFLPFEVAQVTSPDVAIRLHPAGVNEFLRLRRDGVPETYRLEIRRNRSTLTLWSYEFFGRLDTATGRADLAVVDGEGERFDRGLENFLRVLTATYIVQRGGLLVHASGVVRHGSAHLFFGPSGRGKTTVTRLSPDDLVLSDDLSLVIHNGGRFEAVGIPFGMAHHAAPSTSDSFPIASINALVQSPEVRREPLTGALALAELVASLPFVMEDAALSARALDVAGALLREVPAHRLYFRKDPSFWDVIDRAETR